MIESRYLKRFTESNLSEFYELRDNRILLERVDDPEVRTKSGLILKAEPHGQVNSIGADKPLLFIVLAIGQGYADESGKITQDNMQVKVGDIIVMNRLSVKFFSMFLGMDEYVADTIGIARENEIEMRFFGNEGLEKYLNNLNKR